VSSSGNKQRITLFIDPSITKQSTAQAVIEEITLTALVERALLNYLPPETIIKKVDFRKHVDQQS